jgi:two-component system chemotaxis response regulator CheB
MSAKRIVAIGASSGGIEAVRTIAAGLPADFDAAVCVVIHLSPDAPSLLGNIVGKSAALPTTEAQPGERLRPGHIYVAPPDRHLIVEPGVVHLSRGPKENRFRPAIDPLFRSAAQVYGPAAIGVVLTGQLDDGAAGLQTIRQMGGITMVQEPADALFPSMPRNAIAHGTPDYCLPLAAIPATLAELTRQPPEARAVPVRREVDIEVNIAKAENPMEIGLLEITEASQFACPECHGVLLRLKNAYPERFRCHTGHGYSRESLVASVSEGVEEALWNALRSLQEAALLLQELSRHHQGEAEGVQLQARATEARQQADVLRQLLAAREGLPSR